MGASAFLTKSTGPSAAEAFKTAVQNAIAEHGDRGETGTIADKKSFVMIGLTPDQKQEYAGSLSSFAWDLIADSDNRIFDPHGPVGCIHAGGDDYIFVGRSRD